MKSMLGKAKKKLNVAGRAESKKKRLGIDIDALIKKFFDKEPYGYLTKEEFEMFWQALSEDATDLNTYLQYLILRLLHYLPSTKVIKADIAPQVLINTINFLSLCIALPSSKQIADVVAKWNKNRVKYDNRNIPAAKDVRTACNVL